MHVYPHTPAEQVDVPFTRVGHVAPHAPQLLGSLCSLTQPPLHTTVGDGHDNTHTPAEHTLPVGHAVPHAPQLLPLVLRFVSQPFAAMPSQLP